MLDVVELNKLFWYDDEIGQLRWRVRSANRVKVDDVAGTAMGLGYRRVVINGSSCLVHRLIWIMLKGEIPGGYEIDHCDGNQDNNRITNLRLATHHENMHNARISQRNKSGTKGVRFDKERGKWAVQIRKYGKVTSKRLATKEEAVEFARELREKLHQEFANHGVHKRYQKQ